MKLAITLPEQSYTSPTDIDNFILDRALGRHIWKSRLFDTANPQDMSEFNATQPTILEHWFLKDIPIIVLAIDAQSTQSTPAEFSIRTAQEVDTLDAAFQLQQCILTPGEQAEIIKWTNTRLNQLKADDHAASMAAAQAQKEAEELAAAALQVVPVTNPPPPITPVDPVAGTGIIDPLAGAATFVQPPVVATPAPAPTEGELEESSPIEPAPTEGELDAPEAPVVAEKKRGGRPKKQPK
jgi:hypothetical protein